MNKSEDRRRSSSLILHVIMVIVVSGLFQSKVQAQENYSRYEGMYGGYGAKVVLMLDKEIRFYMIVTQGKQQLQNKYFEYKSIMSSRGPIEIKDYKYAYSRGRYEGEFLMKDGRATAVNHEGDEKKKLTSLADLLKHMEVDARELLEYMTTEHAMSAERVKELVLAPKLTDYLHKVDLAKFNLINILLAADKL
ncbi:MAG: hypothetical protein HEP71_32910 [Roseivirga sp.]|nr:hypothetical protein [Roseivirga sp.]